MGCSISPILSLKAFEIVLTGGRQMVQGVRSQSGQHLPAPNALHCYNSDMKSARQSYVSQLINNNQNNASFLFSSINKLINPSKSTPHELLSTTKCDEFAVFFQEKVSHIRDNILVNSSNTSSPTSPSHQIIVISSMSTFSPVNSTDLEEVIQRLKSSTSSLDSIPTKLFKSVYHCFKNDRKYHQ